MRMDDRKLLLLGLLRVQAMHGYQLHQFLEEHLDFLPGLKAPTAYYTLEKMAAEGLVISHEEQAGNRPVRQIYTITPAGEAEFRRLLRSNLSRYDPGESADDIGIGFLAELPPEEVRACLAQKRAAIQARLAHYQEVLARLGEEDGMHLSLRREVMRCQADLAWLDQVEAWLDRTQTHPVDTADADN